jgi:prefoldin subunit 5
VLAPIPIPPVDNTEPELIRLVNERLRALAAAIEQLEAALAAIAARVKALETP